MNRWIYEESIIELRLRFSVFAYYGICYFSSFVYFILLYSSLLYEKL